MMRKNKYKWLAFFTAFVCLFPISCENRDWDNPFDPDCPKELFTPFDFTAKQEDELVQLTWTQSNPHISGFVIERSVDGGIWSTVESPGKTETSSSDINIEGGKNYSYRIVAKAGNNASFELTTQITAILPITDIEGNIYKIVKIGNQVWMAENLKTTKYNDGTPIPNVADDSVWATYTNGAYCFYSNNTDNAIIYGNLYNWYTVVDNHKLCPSGWHIPSLDEFQTLAEFLGGSETAGGKLKETGIVHWLDPNEGATNESGFALIPSGDRNYFGNYENLRRYSALWTTNESGNFGYVMVTVFNKVNVSFSGWGKLTGLPVRCIKD